MIRRTKRGNASDDEGSPTKHQTAKTLKLDQQVDDSDAADAVLVLPVVPVVGFQLIIIISST